MKLATLCKFLNGVQLTISHQYGGELLDYSFHSPNNTKTVASITHFCFDQASPVAYQPNTASTKCPQVVAVILFEAVNGISAKLFQHFMDWMVSTGSGPTLPDSYNSALSPNAYPPFSNHDPTFCYAYAVSMIYTLVCSLVNVTAGLLVGLPVFFFGQSPGALGLLTEGLYNSFGCSEMSGPLAAANWYEWIWCLGGDLFQLRQQLFGLLLLCQFDVQL